MKLLSLGTAYVDINAIKFPFTDGLFPEKEIKGNQYHLEPGGSALNFARFCAALELEPIFIGKIGNDQLGDSLEKLCQQYNITPAFIRSSEVQTNIGVNLVNAEGKTLMAAVGTANQSLSINEVEIAVAHHLDDIDYLYLGGCFGLKKLIPAFADIIRQAKKNNKPVLIDHGRVHTQATSEDIQLMKEIIQMADYYFPSRDELLQVWKTDSIPDTVKKIQANSSVKVIVKDSTEGSFAYINGQETHAPIFPVTVKNTVGAGDSFNAGFIKGLSLNLPIEDCLRYGNATAALKISQITLQTHASVEKLLEKE